MKLSTIFVCVYPRFTWILPDFDSYLSIQNEISCGKQLLNPPIPKILWTSKFQIQLLFQSPSFCPLFFHVLVCFSSFHLSSHGQFLVFTNLYANVCQESQNFLENFVSLLKARQKCESVFKVPKHQILYHNLVKIRQKFVEIGQKYGLNLSKMTFKVIVDPLAALAALQISNFHLLSKGSDLDPADKEIPDVSHRPWYMKEGQIRPVHAKVNEETNEREAKVLPLENVGEDRIPEQLMYVPPKGFVPENMEDSEAPLKKILLWNGLSSWGGLRPGRGVFIKEQCPVSSCVITSNRIEGPKADLVVFKVKKNCFFPNCKIIFVNSRTILLCPHSLAPPSNYGCCICWNVPCTPKCSSRIQSLIGRQLIEEIRQLWHLTKDGKPNLFFYV